MRGLLSIYRPKMSVFLAVALAGPVGWHGTGTTAFCPVDGKVEVTADLPADHLFWPLSTEDVLDWDDQGAPGPVIPGMDGRSTPLLLVASLPPDLGEIDSVEQRKRAFVSIVLPLAMWTNKAILADRRFVEKAVDCGKAGRPLYPAARARLDRLAADYDAQGDLSKLERRLDVVPPSLLLAQAAIESGWGTSRFAMEGNALFGQRTSASGRGMRAQGADDTTTVHVAAFPHLLASVRSYVHNLNTQPAYRTFRERRAALRKQGEWPDGLALAAALASYSERGSAYVRDLKAIIRDNRFDAIDDAPVVADGGSDA